jgi:hypothetical protein
MLTYQNIKTQHIKSHNLKTMSRHKILNLTKQHQQIKIHNLLIYNKNLHRDQIVISIINQTILILPPRCRVLNSTIISP